MFSSLHWTRLRGGGAAGSVWSAPLMPVISLGFVEIGGKGSRALQQGGAEGKDVFILKGKLAGAAGELVGVEIHLVEQMHEEIAERRVVLGIVCEITSGRRAGEQDGVVARVMRAGVPKIAAQ